MRRDDCYVRVAGRLQRRRDHLVHERDLGCPSGETCRAVGSCSVAATPCFDDLGCLPGETCTFSGTCDNDSTVTCGANADCAEQGCFVSSATTCTEANGTASQGSCCDL